MTLPDPDQDKQAISPSFCILPWVNFFSFPNGDVAPCCMAVDTIRKPEGHAYSLRYDDPFTIWNSPAYQHIRQAMLEGKELPICRMCYDNERKGMTSHRRNLNGYFFGGGSELDLYDIKKFTDRLVDASDRLTAKLPQYLDVRLGNLCNLKCRMCYPNTSSQVERDKMMSLWNGETLQKSYGEDVSDWPEALGLMEKLRVFSIEAVRFELAGGEPTLNKSQLELLQYFVDRNQAATMHLQIVSNFTNIQAKAYAIFSAFKTVQIFASLDGYGDVYTYIRFPAKWSAVSENVKAVKKNFPHFHLMAAPAYQAYNILSMCDLFDWCLDVGIEPATQNLLDHPRYLSCAVLPEEARHLAAARFEAWFSLHKDKLSRFTQINIPGLIAYLRDPAVTATDEDIDNFVRYTNDLDLSRGQSIKDSIPELYEIWCRHRSWDHNATRHFSKKAA